LPEGGRTINSTDSTLIDQLRNAVRKTVREFQEYPADFLSENDIQSLLFAELRREMCDLRYDFSGVEHRFSQIHTINPVKTEYQLNPNGFGPRVDIAVLSELQNLDYNLWRQPCRIAIEIKLWQPGGPYGDPWDDIEKLKIFYRQARDRKGSFSGIAMLFVHPFAKKWLSGMPDIVQHLEKTAGVGRGPDFPTDGIVLHVVTVNPSDWKWKLEAES
jgi:hypothetical protein